MAGVIAVGEAIGVAMHVGASDGTVAHRTTDCGAAIDRVRAVDWTRIVARTVVLGSVVVVIPGAGADEDAVGKPAGAIVARGRTGVRSVAVVAICAHGGGADCDRNGARTDGDADADLRVGIGGGEEQNSQQSSIF